MNFLSIYNYLYRHHFILFSNVRNVGYIYENIYPENSSEAVSIDKLKIGALKIMPFVGQVFSAVGLVGYLSFKIVGLTQK
jgi:hypothetical protein